MPTTTSTTSWLAKRLLAALPAAFLLFTSCEEPTDIGLDMQPDSELGVSYIEYTAIETSSILLDSALETTGGSAQVNHLAGYIEDPVFGTVTAITYAELRLANTSVTFGTAPVAIDSVRMRLDYRGAYGLRNKQITLNVHELTESILKDSTYYTKDEVAYSSGMLGSATITPADLKPTASKRKFVTFELDTIFGRTIMAPGLGSTVANHDAYRNDVKGIAIVPEITPGNGKSVVNFGFDRDSDSAAYVQVFYRQNNERKSFRVYLDKGTRRFHSIETNRANTLLAPLQQNGASLLPVAPQGYPETFIQGGSSIRTLLRFPGLENLRQQLGSEIAINKAELLIPVVGGSATEYAPPPFLTIAEAKGTRIKTTPAGNPYYIGTDNIPSLQQLLRYDANKGHYIAQIGTYLQSVLYGRKENTGIMLSSTSNTVQVDRARLPIPGPSGIRLRIYYTKVK